MADKAEAAGMLGHMVFFTLKESTPENRQKLVDSCNKHLDGHPGVVHYSAGVRIDEFNRPVNDQTFDVALHLVFQSKEDHDRYQTAERHLQFISENKDSWKQVRVFDSTIGK